MNQMEAMLAEWKCPHGVLLANCMNCQLFAAELRAEHPAAPSRDGKPTRAQVEQALSYEVMEELRRSFWREESAMSQVQIIAYALVDAGLVRE